MEESTHTEVYADADQVVAAFSGEELRIQAREALRRLDLDRCISITKCANSQPAAGPAMCELLQKPRTLKGSRAWRKDPWIDMRIAAIQALRQSKNFLAGPTLAHVVLSDVAAVRAEACLALRALGSHSVQPLIERIRVETDWPLDGMLSAIETLATLQDRTAGPTLARILFGLLPGTPTRWLKLHLKWSAILGLVESGFVLACVFPWRTDQDVPGFLMAISAGMLWIMFSTLSAMGISVLIRRGKTIEANKLNAAASDALISIKDPRSIPCLIEVATEKYSQSARVGATRAIIRVLPVLDDDHYGMLSGSVERRLTSMFAMNNSPLNLAVVRALAHVGTGQSAGPIERLSRRKPPAYDTVAAQVQSESERVLPILLERKRLEEAPTVLLRPSQVTSNDGGALLRPASNLASYEECGEQLLRPGTVE